jgi:hypothetical protein
LNGEISYIELKQQGDLFVLTKTFDLKILNLKSRKLLFSGSLKSMVETAWKEKSDRGDKSSDKLIKDIFCVGEHVYVLIYPH